MRSRRKHLTQRQGRRLGRELSVRTLAGLYRMIGRIGGSARSRTAVVVVGCSRPCWPVLGRPRTFDAGTRGAEEVRGVCDCMPTIIVYCYVPRGILLRKCFSELKLSRCSSREVETHPFL